jgi:hypothetical protein
VLCGITPFPQLPAACEEGIGAAISIRSDLLSSGNRSTGDLIAVDPLRILNGADAPLKGAFRQLKGIDAAA